MKSRMGRPKMHMAGDNFCVRIRGVPVLEDGTLERVEVDATIGCGVGHEEPLDGFDS